MGGECSEVSGKTRHFSNNLRLYGGRSGRRPGSRPGGGGHGGHEAGRAPAARLALRAEHPPCGTPRAAARRRAGRYRYHPVGLQYHGPRDRARHELADPGTPLSAAITASTAGDPIEVCAGTYDEQLAITRGLPSSEGPGDRGRPRHLPQQRDVLRRGRWQPAQSTWWTLAPHLKSPASRSRAARRPVVTATTPSTACRPRWCQPGHEQQHGRSHRRQLQQRQRLSGRRRHRVGLATSATTTARARPR